MPLPGACAVGMRSGDPTPLRSRKTEYTQAKVMMLFPRPRVALPGSSRQNEATWGVLPWDRGRLARIGSAQQSAVASGILLAFLILRGLQGRQDAGAPSVPGSWHAAFQVA